MTALHSLGLHALSRLLETREISAFELTEALIARGMAMRGTHAMVTPTHERARAAARACDADRAQGLSCGPLHGIPVAVKDAYAVAGVPTQLCGRFTPDADADAVTALARAGMPLLGKLHCAEYCLGAPGGQDRLPFARNPYDPARSPGASSSGSGVALAAGLVPAALGTDTGGSIRIPAAFCGVTGLKPTGGLIGTKGVFPLAPTLDQAGPMARDSRDCALLMDALLGRPGLFSGGLEESLAGMRIGHVPRFGLDAGATQEQRDAIAGALAVFAGLGATIREVSLPPLQAFTDCFLPLMLAQAHALHRDAFETDTAMSAATRARLSGGADIDAGRVRAAGERRLQLTQAIDALWEEVDLLIWEVVPGDPPRVADIRPLDYLKAPMLCVPANLADTPALATRCGTSRAGLPMAMQIVGPRGADARVLRAGHAHERATGHTGLPVEPLA